MVSMYPDGGWTAFDWMAMLLSECIPFTCHKRNGVFKRAGPRTITARLPSVENRQFVSVSLNHIEIPIVHGRRRRAVATLSEQSTFSVATHRGNICALKVTIFADVHSYLNRLDAVCSSGTTRASTRIVDDYYRRRLKGDPLCWLARPRITFSTAFSAREWRDI